MTLTEFLTARLDEDVAVARARVRTPMGREQVQQLRVGGVRRPG